MGCPSTMAGFKCVLPESAPGISCKENEALIIDSCMSRLKQMCPDKFPDCKRVHGRLPGDAGCQAEDG
ncbi:hypothetical protein [Pantoea dispersa]|uniref:hypothetical protein n=1 Tax=Pantoea dispersa TaxID=59814 RepID=UPI003B8A885D